MNKKLAFCVVLVALATYGLPSVATAWDYSGYCGLANWWYPAGSLYVDEQVPYFILHPPVYYSRVVPRAYGYSPFPYPPGVLTPERQSAGPAVVQNNYTVGDASAAAESVAPRRPPLRMQNPFVTGKN